MKASGIEWRNITAGYGDSTVLRNFDLKVNPGELMALLGQSGCGKTTVLRVAAGLLQPQEGDVLFDDQLVTQIPPDKRNAGMVFQKPLLFPHLTVAGNIAFGLKMRGVPEAEIRKRVDASLSMVRLEGFANRKATELSGGQEQRVSLARSLVTQPRVLLLDEPFAALDEPLRVEMGRLLRELQRETGMTTVFVTHDQREASRIADRIGVMFEGRIEQLGQARDFYQKPATANVARFFGWRVWSNEDGHEKLYLPSSAKLLDLSTAPEEGLLTQEGEVQDSLDAGTHTTVMVRTLTGVLEVHTINQTIPTGTRVKVSARVSPDTTCQRADTAPKE